MELAVHMDVQGMVNVFHIPIIELKIFPTIYQCLISKQCFTCSTLLRQIVKHFDIHTGKMDRMQILWFTSSEHRVKLL